jgi:hypothetical protein
MGGLFRLPAMVWQALALAQLFSQIMKSTIRLAIDE